MFPNSVRYLDLVAGWEACDVNACNCLGSGAVWRKGAPQRGTVLQLLFSFFCMVCAKSSESLRCNMQLVPSVLQRVSCLQQARWFKLSFPVCCVIIPEHHEARVCSRPLTSFHDPNRVGGSVNHNRCHQLCATCLVSYVCRAGWW